MENDTKSMNFGIIDKYNSITQVTDKKLNPFIEHLNLNERITLKRFKKNEAVTTDKISDYQTIQDLTEENKELGKLDLGIGKVKRKQTSPFVLVYLDVIIPYKELSGNALKCLYYIYYEKLDLGKDYIVLSPKELVIELKMNKNNAYDVFVELLNSKVIDKRNDNVWWINPNYFYRGNRLKIYSK